MRWIAVIVAALGCAGVARADGLDAKTVSADAKWIVHLDVDALRASKIGQEVMDKIQGDEAAQARIQVLLNMTGVRFPEDLHGVTLWGKGFGHEQGVVLFDVKTDQNKIMDMLKLNPAYGSSKHGTHDVLTWEDKGKTLFGAFHGDAQVIISESKENVEASLDVLDGGAAALSASSSLIAGDSAHTVLYVAGESLSQLKGARVGQSQVLTLLESACITGSAKDDGSLTVQASIVAKSDEAAQATSQLMNGFKALVMLGGAADDANAEAKGKADAVKGAVVSVHDKTVSVEWTIPAETVKEAISKWHGRD